MKASFISTLRLFKKHIARLITIIAIVIVSIGFMSGVGEVETTLKTKINEHYKTYNTPDFYLKSKTQTGFSAEELEKIEGVFGSENLLKTFCYEFEESEKITRVYAYDLTAQKINKLKVLEGRLPENTTEILAERKTDIYEGASVGEEVSISRGTYTVVGVVQNPLLLHRAEETSFINTDKNVSRIYYVNQASSFMVNDVYAVIGERSSFNAFSKKYEDKIEIIKADLISKLGENNVSVLSLFENFGLYSLNSYADKIGMISIIFVVFFLLVTLLVVYSTMSRLLDEERNQIACQKTLGYSSSKITGKYTFFVFVATFIGGAFAFGVGQVLTKLIYGAMCAHYDLPKYGGGLNFVYYLFTFGVIMLSTVLLTFATGMKIADKKPVELLGFKTAKSGKNVFIENISFMWNKLSFRYKSTFRNVFLFKSRFFMTVISIIGSSVLVLAGMGLFDCAVGYKDAESIVAIAIVIIAFSAALSALVIYNITNINVSERNREIATLMVLGYHEKEVTGYIFREVYIMSLIGALLGLPLGYLFLDFAFELINFGSISQMNWWTWCLAPLVTMFFSFLATLLLRKKIVKIDMNESLKSIE